MSGLKIEVGSEYLNASGNARFISGYRAMDAFPFRDKDGNVFNHLGESPHGTEYCLVSLVKRTPTKENPITLRGPEALIFLRDNEGGRAVDGDRVYCVSTSEFQYFECGEWTVSYLEWNELLTKSFNCYTEPQPRYTTTDSQILDNGKELSRQEIAELLNKCDADG